MARLAKHHVHAALDRAAAHIVAAGGDDGRVSRRYLEGLRGAERGLVAMLYRFTDHRDAAPGAQVTRSDVEATVAYTKAKLVDAYDLNRNGLSQAEIERISTTAKLAVSLARALKRQAVEDSIDAGAQLADEIGQLTPGLIFDDFGTEGTSEGFTAVHREASLDPLAPLDAATVAVTLGLDANDPAQAIVRFITDLDDFFADLRELHRQLEQAPWTRADALVDLMQASLRSTVAAIVGLEPQLPVYIVGVAPDGDLVGLRSTVIWT